MVQLKLKPFEIALTLIYQDILEQGKKQEALYLCNSLLSERFEELDSSIIARVQVLSFEKLEALGKALFRISTVDDLVAWLDEQGSN
ncbi:DUF4351 domain-containing protein [Calothrix rhizosoleniae]|uniref:DUF4351 domain-containing protein n=1 Tax=Calothrix rhizosoleniae TaxID=888997 RepID=UPI000B4A34F3|nr:DUF4351 domain-containing protein [Calothrix rhizosoleniae]